MASQEAWTAQVYDLLRDRYALEEEDVSVHVSPAAAEAFASGTSPESFVRALADRFRFYEMK